MKEKYIDLLLNRCLNFDKSNILFISYDKVNQDYVDIIKYLAESKGLEVVLDMENIEFTHKLLKELTVDEIKSHPYFNKSKWDIYASKNASFLMLDTEFPHYLDDIDLDKISIASFTKRKSRPIFRHKETNYEIPWVIAAVPNKVWAKDIYKVDNSYELLENAIYKMCMVDRDNPIEEWNNYLKEVKKISNYLNSLNIKKLHYTNSLGTDLIVSYPNNIIWSSVADDLDHNMLVNMPSYEIFTSPDYRYTEGIVYSSRTLIYGGGIIDEFYLEFKDGKVITYVAKKGLELLKGIIESDSNSCYLGETALVNYDSPISNTGLVFGTTLIDENASCHLALGDGFSTSIPNGTNMSKEELLNNGINESDNHVDFMIGTNDMKIDAYTDKGIITIFDRGNFIK